MNFKLRNLIILFTNKNNFYSFFLILEMNNSDFIISENILNSDSFNNLKKLFCQNNNTATGYEIFVILLLLVLLSSVKFYKIYRQNVRRTV